MFRANQTLNEDQITWIKEATEKVSKSLRETPQDGEQFLLTVKVSHHTHDYFRDASLLSQGRCVISLREG